MFKATASLYGEPLRPHACAVNPSSIVLVDLYYCLATILFLSQCMRKLVRGKFLRILYACHRLY